MANPVRRQAVIDGLVIGFTQERTAELAGCSQTTVARVAHEYRDYARAERDELAERTSAQLLGLVPAAVAELERLLVTGSESTRLNVCKFVVASGPLDLPHLAALFAYGVGASGVDDWSDDELLLMDREHSHVPDVRRGCAACDLYAELLARWLDPARNVGEPGTWNVATVNSGHVTAWLDHRHITATAQAVAAVRRLFTSPGRRQQD